MNYLSNPLPFTVEKTVEETGEETGEKKWGVLKCRQISSPTFAKDVGNCFVFLPMF